MEKLRADKGIARIHFRGGSEEERDALSNVLLARLPKSTEMDYNYSSYDADDHYTYSDFRNPESESLMDFPPKKSEQVPIITFDVICHAAESIERQYKGRVLGDS